MVNENLPHKNTHTAVWLIQNNEYFMCLIVQYKIYFTEK